jgi:hypothetical protein
MLFGIAGGVGIGVAAFHYAKENFSSFFLAGRHLWFDDKSYLENALKAFGLKATIKESAGAKTAEKQLRDVLADGPCVAWVDMALLPHRALPAEFAGGGYHIVPIYRIDDDAKAAIIGDLTDEPIEIPLTDLAAARARIKKQAHRLLSVPKGAAKFDLAALIRDGLRICRAMTAKPGKGPLAWSTLESLKRCRDRMANSKDKESWEKLFPPGPNLWRALTWINLTVEWYGTGGGLCRCMMADFLNEAADALADDRLKIVAQQYTSLGHEWSALADTALSKGVPAFRKAKEQQARYAELLSTNGSIGEKREVWGKLDALAAEVKACFPLNDAQAADLRAELQGRMTRIIALEEAALAEIAKLVS